MADKGDVKKLQHNDLSLRKGIRSNNELEIIGIVLEENLDIKSKVLKFMKKNFPHVFEKNNNPSEAAAKDQKQKFPSKIKK